MNVMDILNKPWVIPVAVGAAGLASGFVAGYKLGQKNMDTAWENRVNSVKDWVDELEEDHIRGLDLNKFPGSETTFVIEDESQDFVEVHEDEVSEDPSKGVHKIVNLGPAAEPDAVLTRVNVFKAHENDWDEETEVASRIDGQPYIIHETEYMENKGDWVQETVTYYEGDDIVADQADTPMYAYSNVLGKLDFGHGANDPGTVYIRNPQIRKEFEVLRHSGHYAIEVLGNTIEHEYEKSDLKHSNDLKFRSD